MAQDQFVNRHIGNAAEEVEQMLGVIGVGSVGELIDQVVPPQIQLPKPLELDRPMSEYEFAAHIRELGAKNRPLRTLIGMGYYGTATLAPVMRNIFENPAWYTSYTPYQAEISQGRLEALLNFQTMVSSLTGLEVANCSLLDEATAALDNQTAFAVTDAILHLDGLTRVVVTHRLEEALLSNPAWQTLTAVKEGRFHILDNRLYNLKPNERWGDAYEQLAQILYP